MNGGKDKGEKYKVSQEGLIEINNRTKDNIFVYSIEGICLYANRNLMESLNMDPTGKHIREIFPHRSEEQIQEIITEYKDSWNNQEGFIVSHQEEKLWNGKKRVFSVSKEPILWNGIPAISGIGKDITDLFLAKEEAAKANEELLSINEELHTTNESLNTSNEELAYINKKLEESKAQMEKIMSSILHDLKNPASVINGFIVIAEAYLKDIIETKQFITEYDQEKLNFYFDALKVSSDKILAFVEELHQLRSLNSGVIVPEIASISTKDFFERIYTQQYGYLTSINQKAKLEGKTEKNIGIVFDESIGKFPELFECDEKLLERVLTNLIGNAIKFTDTGYVSIGAQKRGNKYMFFVTDTGIGIEKQDHEAVFQEFKSLDKNYHPVVKGSGLGLSIVTKIVEVLGGRMLPIQSEVGKGSTFSFELPIKFSPKTE